MSQSHFDHANVALNFMNQDHREFAEICGSLLVRLRAKDKGIDQHLDNLQSHTKAHFEAEEMVMRKYQFPPYAIHKSEHDQVLSKMSARIKQWRDDGDNNGLRSWIEVTLGEWFKAHVASMDFASAHMS